MRIIPPLLLATLLLGMLTWCLSSGQSRGSASPEVGVDSTIQPQWGESSPIKEPDHWMLKVLEQLDHRLRGSEIERGHLLSRLAQIEQEQSRLETQRAALNGDIQALRETAKARLTALYKFSQMGYAMPLFLNEGLADALNTGHTMVRVADRDHRLLTELSLSTRKVRAVEVDLASNSASLEALNRQIAVVEQDIVSIQQEKIALLDRIRGEENLYTYYQARLEAYQKTLDTKAFSRKPIFSYRENPFSSRRGRLPLPTAGEVTDPCGKPYGTTHALYKNGIIINAPKGQAIVSIHDGIVVFADWFMEYGKMMIIDHGDHYHSLITHVDELLKEVGEIVRAGEKIATVGTTGSLNGPKLYFEIRHHGKPVDSAEWLAAHNFSNK